MSSPPTTRPPQQERSRQSLARILTAGAELLAERGYDGFAIAELCERAHVSAGSLYARFPSREAVILAVHEHAVDRMSAEAAALYDGPGWDGLDAAGTIERAVALLLTHYLEHRRLLKVFILRSGVDERMQRIGAIGMARIADAFTRRLLTRAAAMPHAEAEAAIQACFAIAFESTSWHVAFGDLFDATLPGVVDIGTRLPEVCRLYLLTPPTP